jgi:Fe-S cluster assembly protein SufB
MSTSTETIEQLATREYKYGFETEVDTDTFPVGLDEAVIRRLSEIKQEPPGCLSSG